MAYRRHAIPPGPEPPNNMALVPYETGEQLSRIIRDGLTDLGLFHDRLSEDGHQWFWNLHVFTRTFVVFGLFVALVITSLATVKHAWYWITRRRGLRQ